MPRASTAATALTPTKVTVLTALWLMGGAAISNLLRWVWPQARSHSRAQATIKQMETDGLIIRRRMPPSGGRGSGESWVLLTRRGQQVLLSLGIPAENLSLLPTVPPYYTFVHDRLLRDIRITLERACEQNDRLSLVEWTNEYELRHDPITVADPLEPTAPLEIVPDGRFTLELSTGTQKRFYLEVDRDTIGPLKLRQRLRACLAWLPIHAKGSPVLFTVPSSQRRNEIAALTRQEAGRLSTSPRLVWIALADQITETAVLDQPIWSAVDGPTVALIPPALRQID